MPWMLSTKATQLSRRNAAAERERESREVKVRQKSDAGPSLPHDVNILHTIKSNQVSQRCGSESAYDKSPAIIIADIGCFIFGKFLAVNI